MPISLTRPFFFKIPDCNLSPSYLSAFILSFHFTLFILGSVYMSLFVATDSVA